MPKEIWRIVFRHCITALLTIVVMSLGNCGIRVVDNSAVKVSNNTEIVSNQLQETNEIDTRERMSDADYYKFLAIMAIAVSGLLLLSVILPSIADPGDGERGLP